MAIFSAIMTFVLMAGMVVFDIWYIFRTPTNLRKWYAIPVILLEAIIAAWMLLELGLIVW